MRATGIGAAVRRKEDFRFITGKGQYTDDIDRSGQSYIHFLRSPHAHARIKAVDAEAAAAMPGVLAVLTGADLAADKIGGLICGWMIHSKDGSPMKAAPHPAIAHDKACFVGDPVAVVIATTLEAARDAAEKVKVDYQVLPAVADPAKAQAKDAPQIHAVAPRNTIYQWHLGDAKAVDQAFKSAGPCDQARNRQQPPGAERHGAARRDRRLRFRHVELHALEHHPESACRAPRHLGLRRHGAGAQAAGDRARCRRRLRLQDLHLSGRGGVPVGGQEGRPPGQMGVGAQRGLPGRRAWARSRHPRRDGARRRRQDRRHPRQDHRQYRRLHVDLLLLGADLSLRHPAVGPVRHPAHLLRGRRGLYQHRAGRRLSRRRAAGSHLRGRAPDRGQRPPACDRADGAAAQELHRHVPAPDAGDHEL